MQKDSKVCAEAEISKVCKPYFFFVGRSKRSHWGRTCSPTAAFTTQSGEEDEINPAFYWWHLNVRVQTLDLQSYWNLLKWLFLSMETLSEMFELEIPTVHSIISKMIINEELMVSSWPCGFSTVRLQVDCTILCNLTSLPTTFSSGFTGPANTDCGDASHGAHVPAEHGPAAGWETGQPRGEQRARLRRQTGRLRRLLQQRCVEATHWIAICLYLITT